MPRKSKKSKKSCIIEGCQSLTKTYRFPQEEKKRRTWLENMGLPNSTPKTALLCANHWDESCFTLNEYGKRRRPNMDPIIKEPYVNPYIWEIGKEIPSPPRHRHTCTWKFSSYTSQMKTPNEILRILVASKINILYATLIMYPDSIDLQIDYNLSANAIQIDLYNATGQSGSLKYKKMNDPGADPLVRRAWKIEAELDCISLRDIILFVSEVLGEKLSRCWIRTFGHYLIVYMSGDVRIVEKIKESKVKLKWVVKVTHVILEKSMEDSDSFPKYHVGNESQDDDTAVDDIKHFIDDEVFHEYESSSDEETHPESSCDIDETIRAIESTAYVHCSGHEEAYDKQFINDSDPREKPKKKTILPLEDSQSESQLEEINNDIPSSYGKVNARSSGSNYEESRGTDDIDMESSVKNSVECGKSQGAVKSPVNSCSKSSINNDIYSADDLEEVSSEDRNKNVESSNKNVESTRNSNAETSDMIDVCAAPQNLVESTSSDERLVLENIEHCENIDDLCNTENQFTQEQKFTAGRREINPDLTAHGGKITIDTKIPTTADEGTIFLVKTPKTEPLFFSQGLVEEPKSASEELSISYNLPPTVCEIVEQEFPTIKEELESGLYGLANEENSLDIKQTSKLSYSASSIREIEEHEFLRIQEDLKSSLHDLANGDNSCNINQESELSAEQEIGYVAEGFEYMFDDNFDEDFLESAIAEENNFLETNQK